MFGSWLPHLRAFFGAAVTGVLLTAAIAATPAAAGPGYELDPAEPSISLPGEVPHGVAVDQESQDIYVTELTTSLFSGGHGQITQLTSSGLPTANSPFVTGGDDFFVGVAVNPVTKGVYAYQSQIVSPQGTRGALKMSTFSSSGVLGSSFTPPSSIPAGPQVAADAAGRVYFPNDGANAIQVFESSGTLKDTIQCTGCPGGSFSEPVSVAVDSAGKLYVVDMGGAGRVLEFKPSGGSFVYDSVLQSGAGAVAVAVDPANNDVFVGDLREAAGGFHIVAYDSSGAEFDDFGGELVSLSLLGRSVSAQMAVNGTTHKLYVSDPGGDQLWVFDRIPSIPSPGVTTSAATSLGQQEATLRGMTNPKGHSLSDCHFEYTEASDFQVNGYANATSIPCSSSPGGSVNTPVVARVGSLTPNLAYDYRLFVTSSGGSSEGTDQSFTTLPPLEPTVSTGSASAITQTTATIAGSVNPHGGRISECHFAYTSEADFQEKGFTGSASAKCPLTPEGTGSSPVSAGIKGLTAGTGYRFRVVATNNSGTAEAVEQTFKTLDDTCTTKPTLCPPPQVKQGPVSPPAGAQLPPLPITPVTKPLKCHKGFKKKKVHGKPKCVKVKKNKRHHG